MELIRKLPTRISKSGHLESWGVFKCPDCLQEVERRLTTGLIAKSCGCERSKRNSYTKLYSVWTNMKQRVLNPNNTRYKDYGGRGITICPEWTNDYITFRNWALHNGYQEGLIFDRENPNGNYEPFNCRFLTITESLRNKTNTMTKKIVDEIRALYKTGNYKQRELVKMFNLHKATISAIINNKIW